MENLTRTEPVFILKTLIYGQGGYRAADRRVTELKGAGIEVVSTLDYGVFVRAPQTILSEFMRTNPEWRILDHIPWKLRRG